MPSDRVPSLCRHKSAGQGYVTLNGQEHYLGTWPGSRRRPPPQVQAAYDALIARWLAHGKRLPGDTAADDGPTVNDVLLAWDKHAEGCYRPTKGKVSTELACVRDALKIVKALFGRTPAAEFGPKKLKAVRQKMLEKGWCRGYVNHQVDRVRRVFKWAVAEELVPGEVHHALQAVAGVRRGVPGVRESEPVRPVPEAFVEAAKPFLPPPVRAMVELQLLTGMRPGEACAMRAADIDAAGRVWVYRPATHRTAHHGHTREVYLGPRAQEVLKPWLRTDLEAYLFSPAEAEAKRDAGRRKTRKTPLWPSHVRAQARKRKRRPRRAPGSRYDVAAYRRAIKRACDRAFPPPGPLARRDGETQAAWQARLTAEQKAELAAWRREYRWHPPAATQRRHEPAEGVRRRTGPHRPRPRDRVHDGDLRRGGPAAGHRGHREGRLNNGGGESTRALASPVLLPE